MNAIDIVSVSAAVVMTAAVQPSWARQDPASSRREGPVAISAIGGASVGSGHTGAAAGLTLADQAACCAGAGGRPCSWTVACG